jgi:hypothetical protein
MRFPVRKLLTLAASCLALVPALAQAAEPPCLTPAEFTSLSSYALPSIITGTEQRCSASLPADAFLPRRGPELAARYATRKAEAWPATKAAFLKLSADINGQAGDIIRALPDTSLQPLVDTMIQGIVSQQLPIERCGIIDRLVNLLSPLPPESTAEIIGLAVGLGSKAGRGHVGKITICAT